MQDHVADAEVAQDLGTDAVVARAMAGGIGLAVTLDPFGDRNGTWILDEHRHRRPVVRGELTDAVVEIVGTAPLDGSQLWVVSGILSQAGGNELAALSAANKRVPPNTLPSLLTAAPFNRGTWKVLEAFPDATRKTYWRDVRPGWTNDDHDLAEGTANLLTAERPRAAFQFAHFKIGGLPTHLLFNLMLAITMGSDVTPVFHPATARVRPLL